MFMEKRETKLLIITGIFFALVLALVLIFSLHYASADIVDADSGTGTPSVAGIDPEKMPQDEEELKSKAETELAYLKQEWNKFILKIPYIGKMHTFFLAHPMIFKIVFAHAYEFSLTFICIVAMWLLIAYIFSELSGELVKGGVNVIIGIGAGIIFSQIGFIGGVVDFSLKIIYSRDAWWIRALLWVIIVTIFLLLAYLSNASQELLQQRREDKEREEVKQEAKESKAFRRGVKEGQDLTKDIGAGI